MRYGALEGGGTKMVLAVLDEKMQILCRESIPTRTPDDTMPAMIAFFKAHPVDVLGIATFGPVDLHPSSPTYGFITKTPKLPWVDYPLMPTLRAALGVPCAFESDVNAAAVAEKELGAAKGAESFVYVTVGTGIGAGVFCDGRLLHGLMHPEWGHIPIVPRADDPMPQGVCPYHGACLEGLASGPALEKRWGVKAQTLPPDHPAWELEAHYLAQMCVSAMMMVSPERIIFGGGVMGQSLLFPLIRKETERLLAGYLHAVKDLDAMIVPAACAPNSGILGAALLAKALWEKGEKP